MRAYNKVKVDGYLGKKKVKDVKKALQSTKADSKQHKLGVRSLELGWAPMHAMNNKYAGGYDGL